MTTLELPKVLAPTVLTHRMVKSSCMTNGLEGEIVYGVEVYLSGEVDDYATIKDISSNPHEVEDLIFRLKRGKVTPSQLVYIVEDYLAELSYI